MWEKFGEWIQWEGGGTDEWLAGLLGGGGGVDQKKGKRLFLFLTRAVPGASPKFEKNLV